MARTFTLPERQRAAAAELNIHGRVEVMDSDGVYQDTSLLGGIDWFNTAQVSDSIDQSAATAAVTLQREVEAFAPEAGLFAQWDLDGDAQDFIGTNHGTLCNFSRTNSCIQSRDLNTTWTATGTGASTLNATGITGLANTASTVTDTDAAVLSSRNQSVTIGNDNLAHCVAIWVKKDADTTRFPAFRLQLLGGTTVRRTVDLNTQTGAITTVTVSGTGTSRVIDGALVGYTGWWIVEITCTNNSTGNTTLQVNVYPAMQTVFGSDNVATTGSTVIGHVQIELNAQVFTYPAIVTTTVAVTVPLTTATGPIVGSTTISFDGSNDMITVPDVQALKYTGQDFSAFVWASRSPDDTTSGYLFSKPWNGSGQYNWQLLINSSGQISALLLGATSFNVSSTAVLPAGAFHHVGFTVEAATKIVRIYLDGAIVATGTHTITNWVPTLTDIGAPLAIGSLYPYGAGWAGVPDQAFRGFLDDPRIYNDTLTPGEANQLYLYRGTKSLAPFVTASTINRNAAGAYSPLLDLNRKFRISGAITAKGDTPRARINSLVRSFNLANASWAKSAGMGATLTAIGPDGVANTATLITDSDAANFISASQNVTIPNDSNTHCLSVWIYKDDVTNRFPQVKLVLSNGTQVQRAVAINTATGALSLHNTSGTGTFRMIDGASLGIPAYINWWILEITCTNNSTGNTTAQVSIYPAAGTVIGSDSVAGVGSCIIGNAHLELNQVLYSQLPVYTTTAAATVNDWKELLQGTIDSIDWGGKSNSVVTISGRDISAKILDTYIDTRRTYGSAGGTAMETVISQMLVDNIPSGTPTLVTPTSPAFLVPTFVQDYGSLYDAITEVAAQAGFVVRYRYDATDTLVLTLFKPDRALANGVSFSLDPTEYLDIPGLKISIQDIRTWIELRYIESTTGTLSLVKYPASGTSAAITKFGKRYMAIDEQNGSQINILAKAQAMVDAVGSDLENPNVEHVLESFLLWWVQLTDYIQFNQNGLLYDTAQFGAVTSYTHTLQNGTAKTNIATRGKPSGLYKTWLSYAKALGGQYIAPRITPPSGLFNIATEDGAFGYVAFVFDDPQGNVANYRITTISNRTTAVTGSPVVPLAGGAANTASVGLVDKIASYIDIDWYGIDEDGTSGALLGHMRFTFGLGARPVGPDLAYSTIPATTFPNGGILSAAASIDNDTVNVRCVASKTGKPSDTDVNNANPIAVGAGSTSVNLGAILVTPGTGTLTASAGTGTFSTSQAGIISNGAVVVVGGIMYTVSAFNGTTSCTLSGTPTFTAASWGILQYLNTGERYWIRARAYNSAGLESDITDITDVYVAGSTNALATLSLTATNPSSTSITFVVKPSSHCAEFEIFVKEYDGNVGTDPGTAVAIDNGYPTPLDAVVVGPDATRYRSQPNTDYSIVVPIASGVNWILITIVPYDAIARQGTKLNAKGRGNGTAAPLPPISATADAAPTATSITNKVTLATPRADRVKMYRDNVWFGALVDVSAQANGALVTLPADTGLTPGTTYSYTYSGVDSATGIESVGRTSPINVATTASATIPTPTLASAAYNAATETWSFTVTPGASSPAGVTWKIERATSSGGSYTDRTATFSTSTSLSESDPMDTPTGTDFYFKVYGSLASWTDSVHSAFVGPIHKTGTGEPAVAPTIGVMTNPSGHHVQLSWTNPTDTIDTIHYEMEYKGTITGNVWLVIVTGNLAANSLNSGSQAVTTADGVHQYRGRARYYNAARNGAWSSYSAIITPT